MGSDHQMAMIRVLLVTYLGFFVSLSQGYTFYVGGRDGWVLNPKEDYIHWASRNRFQINDTIIFKFKQGHDTVLEVGKDDYYNCYKESPLQALKDGVSVFQFNRPGPFFFISGHADNCAKGQRIIIVVLHPRTHSPVTVTPNPAPASTPAPAPAPTASPAVDILPPLAPAPVPGPAPASDALPHFAPAPAPVSCATIFGGSVLGYISSFLAMVSFFYML